MPSHAVWSKRPSINVRLTDWITYFTADQPPTAWLTAGAAFALGFAIKALRTRPNSYFGVDVPHWTEALPLALCLALMAFMLFRSYTTARPAQLRLKGDNYPARIDISRGDKELAADEGVYSIYGPRVEYTSQYTTFAIGPGDAEAAMDGHVLRLTLAEPEAITVRLSPTARWHPSQAEDFTAKFEQDATHWLSLGDVHLPNAILPPITRKPILHTVIWFTKALLLYVLLAVLPASLYVAITYWAKQFI